ncbi:hypothetical protein ENBRE01_1696 [Enteropsectra breve]|nr:hypothetical protein ENBRE01_1696 [Enteropsectra breve]
MKTFAHYMIVMYYRYLTIHNKLNNFNHNFLKLKYFATCQIKRDIRLSYDFTAAIYGMHESNAILGFAICCKMYILIVFVINQKQNFYTDCRQDPNEDESMCTSACVIYHL